MKNTCASYFNVEYFCPSKSRSAFVDDFMQGHGGEAEVIQGAAHVMGNSVGQWNATYARSRKSRLANMAARVVAMENMANNRQLIDSSSSSSSQQEEEEEA